ncbi:enoyl-CoA hydratase/isomerase family protein [Shewanella avicenniae]|uniref:Enoyl-CoA hydratase/isomerase family protein n=1 Tax=Shewanella avicenniae TaxID=2814294 RepID=A0ABX7QTR6_9GAMM|nr:enoyl-CoA hydratase-related protein [Shewanella avicenniae]QSX34305.1 enoyl-CoA hydratase/isomerase family protein [Shewanella avicenniae]
MSMIKVNDIDGVRIIQFNRLDKLNAINLEMYRELTAYLIEGDSNNDICSFLLCGEPHCFTAGNDIADFLNLPNIDAEHPAIQFLFCLLALKKPLIAAVSGPAIGIGTTMLLHCDLVYADASAQFQLPFINLALVPEAGASMLLPQLVGFPRAAELLLTGEPFNAMQARGYRIINEIIEEDELFEFSLSKAKLIASKPSAAVQQTKALMKPWKNQLKLHMQQELDCFTKCLSSDEARQHFQQFLMNRF